jgi:hypothetical protein
MRCSVTLTAGLFVPKPRRRLEPFLFPTHHQTLQASHFASFFLATCSTKRVISGINLRSGNHVKQSIQTSNHVNAPNQQPSTRTTSWQRTRSLGPLLARRAFAALPSYAVDYRRLTFWDWWVSTRYCSLQNCEDFILFPTTKPCLQRRPFLVGRCSLSRNASTMLWPY